MDREMKIFTGAMVFVVALMIGGMIYLTIVNGDREQWCRNRGYKTTDISTGRFGWKTYCVDDQRRMFLPE